MKSDFSKLFIIILLTFVFSGCNMSKSNVNPRHKILFDFDWKFNRGEVENVQFIDYYDSLWRSIDLPHDWSIEDIPGTNSAFDSTALWGIDGGYLVGGTAWYRKTFKVPQEYAGKRISIYFEGIYMNADVWLNGKHLGNHPYGYTAFEYDLSNLVKIGEENIIAVQVKNEGKNSRWYSGSGIYRHVWLNVSSPVYAKTWGTFITTPIITKNEATVKIRTQIKNESGEPKNLKMVARIINSKGEKVAIEKTKKQLNVDEETNFEQDLLVRSPELWSPENPDLYTAIIQIQDNNGKLLDLIEEKFGIRNLEFSVEKGFLLNGVPTLLKGGCMHHGNGPLGAAAYNRADERRIELMKASGFNAIRCAHNPPSEAFLDACDRIGMLVIDETFDMWRRPKNPQDYSNYFDDWWQRDVDAMVLRDRNHPSVIMWSIGNEIPERGEAEGSKTSKMLADYVRNLDSTRPVTSAVNGLNPDKDPYFATLDIAGYNYSFGGDHGQKSIFEYDHKRVPSRIMYCAESYPLEAFGSWMDVLKYPYVLGDFVWTGFDYLGEASIGWRGYPHDENYYPWNQAFCGDLDICGNKQPQSYYRDVLWEVGDQISLFVKPPVPSFPVKKNRADWSKWHWHDWVSEWNWEGYENEYLGVIVCSRYEKVELFVNGQSLGAKPTNIESEYLAWWSVPYHSGELKAVGMNGDSIKAISVLNTAQNPVKINLTADRNIIKANGQDLSYITVELTDEIGLLNPATDNLVEFEISGPGKIIAVASSNPRSIESFQQPQRKAYKGRCMVIVKSERKPGEIHLKAKSEGLIPSEILIQTN